MILINPLDVCGARLCRVSETDIYKLGRDLMSGLRVISEEHGYEGVFANNPRVNRFMSSIHGKFLVAEVMKQLKSAIDRLWDTVNVEQAKASMKRHRRKIVLFEDVGEGPETIAVNKLVCLHHYLGRIGGR